MQSHIFRDLNRIDQVKKLLETSPNDVFLLYALAIEYHSMGDVNRAINSLNDVKQRFPDYLPTYYQLGLILSENDQDDEAVPILKEGMELAQKTNNHKTFLEIKSLLEEITF